MSLVVSGICARKTQIQKGIIKNHLKYLFCGTMSKQVEKDKIGFETSIHLLN